MKKLEVLRFMSWDEKEHGTDGTIRATGLCTGTWFEVAVNTQRDGDMGKKGEDGVYERIWYQDDIYNADVDNVKASIHQEVLRFLDHYPVDRYIGMARECYHERYKFIGLLNDGEYKLVFENKGCTLWIRMEERLSDLWFEIKFAIRKLFHKIKQLWKRKEENKGLKQGDLTTDKFSEELRKLMEEFSYDKERI